MKEEHNSNQVDYEKGTISESRRYTNSIQNREYCKIVKDITIVPFGTIKAKGIVKTSNHYKCVNVVVDDLPENQCCKDIMIAQQIQVLKPGSNKIPVTI